MNYYDDPRFNGFLSLAPGIMAVIIILAVWSAIWKGFALYRAGANRSPAWFVCLLIFNTLGILEILYIFVFSKKKAVEPTVYHAPAPASPQPPAA